MKEIHIPIGSKFLVEKSNEPSITWQKAQVLSLKSLPDGTMFYVHYEGFNKRLDEWISYSKIKLDSVEIAKAVKKKPPPSKTSPLAQKVLVSNLKRKRGALSVLALGKGKAQKQLQQQQEEQEQKAVQQQQQDVEEEEEEGEDGNALEESSQEQGQSEMPGFSKEKEIEKLRTSGSMTQSLTEIGRLKNIHKIQFGRHEIETWYFSPYPEEYANLDMLYICEFCLEPVGSARKFERHRLKCKVKHPPGNEIYRNNEIQNISFFELDGRKQRRYTRNLCLLSKLFLDHKTLYYDVDPFLFYLMVRTDETGSHLIGYFSKEKLSADDYNVACILTMPQYQRMGYGKVLIEFSYELSKVERKTGSPEKPLSDLGLLSYRSFWADILLEKLVSYQGEITIGELSEITSFTSDDILSTLQNMDILRYFKGQFVICVNEKHLEMYEKMKKKQRIRIDATKLDWIPPRFAPNQLRYL